MKVKNLTIILLCFFFGLSFSQPNKSFIKTKDSLLALPNDSVKIDALMAFCKANEDSNFLEVMELSNTVFDLTTKLKLFKRKAKFYNTIGDMHFNKANYQESYKYYYSAYKLSDSIKSKFHLAMSAYNLGWQAAIQQKNYKDVSYIYFAYNIGREIKSDAIILRTQNALGSFYTDKYDREHKVSDFDSAITYFKSAIETTKSLKRYLQTGALYSNLGQLFYHSKDYASSIFYYEKAKEVYKNDSDNVVGCIFRIGAANEEAKNTSDVNSLYQFVYRYTIKHDLKELRKDVLKGLVEYCMHRKEYKKAYEYQIELNALNDIVNKELNAITLSNLEANYKYTKVEASNFQLKQSGEIQELKNKRKTVYISLLSVMGIVIIVIAYLLFRQNKLKQLTNNQLQDQNKIIREKKLEIEQSIDYAKGIQTSFLPDKELLDIFLPNNFIFYQPKDIVSGDFYWFQTSKNKKEILLACADCTGHGVPGALMSMVGINMLQQFSGTDNLQRPAAILKNLNNGIKNSLKQNSEQSKQRDGMDIGLIHLNLETKKLLFASANRPLYIIRNKQLIELKPSKSAIGGFTDYNLEFEEKEIDLETGDMIVMTTDGYADQFGGENGKKLMTKKMKEYLVEVSSKNSQEQYQYIKQAFNNWKGTYDQVDDVCVVSFSV